MPKDIGPHLLGRVPSPPDSRDYKLADYLRTSPGDLDQALTTLQASRQVARATKDWAAFITTYLKGMVPTPPPVPPMTVLWPNDQAALDQGDTPHCVGFGWAQWGNNAPVDDQFVDQDGHDIYYECKVIDGEPDVENGSDVRSGAKAMQNRHRLTAYAFSTSIDEITEWVSTRGPLTVGTDWTYDMFEPDEEGNVSPTGDVAGGHCYLLVGINGNSFLFLNSWGTSWGNNGYFQMEIEKWAKLFNNDGESCASVELPLT